MRALYSAAMLLLLSGPWTAANGEDAKIAVIICNDRWNPPCRDFPVTTFVPAKNIAEAGQRYTFQVNYLDKDQLQKVFSALGIDQSKIDLESK